MIKLEFKNAVVSDDGYGLTVNGKRLETLISTALGTRVGENYGYKSGLPNFNRNCCNLTVIIDPQPVTTLISNGETEYLTVEELEREAEEKYGELKEADTAAEDES